MNSLIHFTLIFLFTLNLDPVKNDEHNHKYKDQDQVIMWFMKAYPKDNQLESIPYFEFPLCAGPVKLIDHTHNDLLDNLQGLALENSGLEIKYGVNVPSTHYCGQKLEDSDVKTLHYAIANSFEFDIYIDGLKATGEFGYIVGNKYMLFTHMVIKIYRNKDQIVEVSFSQEKLFPIDSFPAIILTYEIIWSNSTNTFEDRYEKYFDRSESNTQIRIISLINSLAMMVIIMGFACWILLRTLRFDILRYSSNAKDDSLSIGMDYGWKVVHEDVFRRPYLHAWLVSIVGTGVQLFFTVILTIIVCLIFDILYEQDKIVKLGINMYISFSPLSSFISGALYKKYEGKRHHLQFLIQIFLFPLLLLGFTSIISIEARLLHISRYLDVRSFFFLFALLLFAVIPLSFFGNFIARFYVSSGNFASKTSELPGPIPKRKWYLRPLPLVLINGVLPFGSMVIEMYFVLNSFWSVKIFTVLEFMAAIIVVMVIVSTCMSIISIYMLLNAEDYRWQWICIFSGFSVSLYLFIYSIHYHIHNSNMTGIFQLSFYYCYTILITISIGMMCGSFNFLAANFFVQKLYKNLKYD